MDELDQYSFLERSLMKLVLLNGGKTEHVNQLFSNRDDKGEFQMLFQELRDQPEKFFDYFRMRPATFECILKEREESIKNISNSRENKRLAVTLR